MATREEIIQDVARTLFICAWADGVESGEIKGNKPGGGGDWEDVAPLSWLFCAECDGRTYLGDVGLDERRCPTCNGRGILYVQDPNAEKEARRIVDAFDRDSRRIPRYAIEGGGSWRPTSPDLAEAEKEFERCADRLALDSPDEPAPRGASDVLRARAKRIGGEIVGWLLLRDRGAPYGPATPIEQAAAIHAELSGSDCFAHCLAMQALGSGVGLSDDLPPGVSLPGWIKASVPLSDFGAHSLDPKRYPAPGWTCPDCAEGDGEELPFVYPVLETNSGGFRVLADSRGEPSNTWEDGTRGVPEKVKEDCRESGDAPLCRHCGQEAVREGSTVDLGHGRSGTVEERRAMLAGTKKEDSGKPKA